MQSSYTKYVVLFHLFPRSYKIFAANDLSLLSLQQQQQQQQNIWFGRAVLISSLVLSYEY